MNTYKQLDVAFERGEGVWLWDTKGNRYLDALAGIAVCALGHAHPSVTKAIQEQANKLLHTSNLYQIPKQIQLAEKLCQLTGLDKAFFCNSGAEAIEAALKLSRLHGHEKGIASPQVVVMERAFHGRTFATISAGGSAKVQAGFEPLMPGFLRLPYNNLEALYQLSDSRKDIAAVLLEPVQGEGGIQVPQTGYLKKIRELCDQNDWLMILDEVQTGMGRTGTLFAYQAENLLPDVLAVAKALANGVPMGACVAGGKAANLFKPGNHGSTFGGNPLACAAGLATLEEIAKHKLWENAKRQGITLLEGLKKGLKDIPEVKEVRGRGLMIGVELDRPARDILPAALKKRLLFNVTNETVLRLLPPLIIQEEQIKQIIEILPGLIQEFVKPS